MEEKYTIDESMRKTIIDEISESLYKLGIEIKDVMLDINADKVNLLISLCNK